MSLTKDEKAEIAQEITGNLKKAFYIDGFDKAVNDCLDLLQCYKNNLELINGIRKLLSTSAILKNESLQQGIYNVLLDFKQTVKLSFNASFSDLKEVVAELKIINPLLLFALGKLLLATTPECLTGLIVFFACYGENESGFISELGIMNVISSYLPHITNQNLVNELIAMQQKHADTIAYKVGVGICGNDIMPFCTEVINPNDGRNKEKFLTIFILQSRLPQKTLRSVLQTHKISEAKEFMRKEIQQWYDEISNTAMDDSKKIEKKRSLDDKEVALDLAKKLKTENSLNTNNVIPSTQRDEDEIEGISLKVT
jgi:hypothetical protein